MLKQVVLSVSTLLGISLATFFQEPPDRKGEGPPPPKGKHAAKEREKTKKQAPGDELRKTYTLLRRIRSDSVEGKSEPRIKDWADRATDLYRRAIQARRDDPHRSHELAIASHDLARAADHAGNAARLDRGDDLELPPPPDGDGPDGADERNRHDLQRAYERIQEALETELERENAFYINAAKDLYNAARRDLEAGRVERGGELARAAEAMTHVPEHLDMAANGEPRGPGGRDGRGPFGPDAKKARRDHQAKKKGARPPLELPPPL